MIIAHDRKNPLLDLIKGLVFFGAPHNGIHFEALEKGLRDEIERVDRLILDLKPNSNFLKSLRDRFGEIFCHREGLRVLSVLEQQRTPESVYDKQAGKVTRSQEKEIAVTTESGKLGWPYPREKVFYDGSHNHSEIAKLVPSMPESKYETIMHEIQEWINKTTSTASLETDTGEIIQSSISADPSNASDASPSEDGHEYLPRHVICPAPGSGSNTGAIGFSREVTPETSYRGLPR